MTNNSALFILYFYPVFKGLYGENCKKVDGLTIKAFIFEHLSK